MQNIGSDQSNSGRWMGHKDTEGEGKVNIQKIVDNGGAGFSLDVTLSTEPMLGEVADRGWNTTTS